MKFDDLDSWLRWQETLHPAGIELGLDRVRLVRDRLEGPGLDAPVITVAGTNGKGTCVAVIEALAMADGRRVAAYTSPHLFRYNERIRVDGSPVDDDRLIAAFEAVDAARGDTPLTYFEFGTLAAIRIFGEADVDLIVLEVGLGGRLDAVNVVDPDVAVITSVGLDHMEWLGDDRETIGAEKAGILRRGIPLVLGDPDPPASVLRHAEELGAAVDAVGAQWSVSDDHSGWSVSDAGRRTGPLPYGPLSGVLVRNAACAIRAYGHATGGRVPGAQTLSKALSGLVLPGRMQRLRGGWLVDLAHNPEGAVALAEELRRSPVAGRTLAVFGIFSDKDIDAVSRVMAPLVDHWFVAELDSHRGERASSLRGRLVSAGAGGVSCHSSVANACVAAEAAAGPDDRIVAFGSFHVVAPTLQALGVYSPAGHAGAARSSPR
jgi:dihydrofolate synthase/folylpolyglutamate synthase